MGHLVTAEVARQQFKLDHVIFIPAGIPPHKDIKTINGADTAILFLLAVVDNPYFTVSRLEIDNNQPSYTIDTVLCFYEIIMVSSTSILLPARTRSWI